MHISTRRRSLTVSTVFRACVSGVGLEELLREIFSSKDEDLALSPVEMLVDLTVDYFSEEGHRELEKALPRARFIVGQARRRYWHVLETVEKAQLIAAEGHLAERWGYAPRCTNAEKAARYAARSFEDAARLLPEAGPESALRRHFFWRAANVCASLDWEDTAATLIEHALTGDPARATSGLYFNCASRLACLNPRLVQRTIARTEFQLQRAWAYIPGHDDGRRNNSLVLKTAIGSLLSKEERLQIGVGPPLRSSHNKFEVFHSGGRPGLLDRVGVCVLLALKSGLTQQFYLREAETLLGKVVSNDPYVVKLCEVIASVEKTDFDLENLLSFSPEVGELRNALVQRRLDHVMRAGSKLLNRYDRRNDPVSWAQTAIGVGDVLGSSKSARDELELLIQARHKLQSDFSIKALKLRAYLHQRIARVHWYRLETQHAIEELEQSLTWSGCAADPVGVVLCIRLLRKILIEIGAKDETERVEGLVAILADCWKHPEWNDLCRRSTGDPKEDITENLIRPTATADNTDVIFLAYQWTAYLKRIALVETSDVCEAMQVAERLEPLRALRTQYKLLMAIRTHASGEMKAKCYELLLQSLSIKLSGWPTARRGRVLGEMRVLLTEAILNQVFDAQKMIEYLYCMKATRAGSADQANTENHCSGLDAPAMVIPTNRYLAQQARAFNHIDMTRLLQTLFDRNAAYVEYFFGNKASGDVILVAYAGEIHFIPTDIQSPLEKLVSGARRADRRRSYFSASTAFEIFRKITSPTDDRTDLMDMLKEIATACFPPQLVQKLAPADTIFASTLGTLERIPIHALPVGDSVLIDWKKVSFVPNADHLLRNASNTSHKHSVHLCIDVTDPQIRGNEVVALFNNRSIQNVWETPQSATAYLRAASDSRQAWFYGHCYRDRGNPFHTRLALPSGVRLRAADVLAFNGSFENTTVFLLGCNTGRIGSLGKNDTISLASAFLRKNAKAVVSTLWSPSVGGEHSDYVIPFIEAYRHAEDEGHDSFTAFQSGLREAASGRWLRPYTWLRLACFVYQGA